MHLYLIGYRGSGKSTVGRLLAARLDMPFLDTDQVIESRSGSTIREIFAKEGESGFRDREQQAVADAGASRRPSIIALGGGAVLREANRERMQTTGKCVWLRGSAPELFGRIETDTATADRRPNLLAGGGYDEVVELLAAREPIYRELAQFTVTTDGKSPDELTAEIAAWVSKSEQGK